MSEPLDARRPPPPQTPAIRPAIRAVHGCDDQGGFRDGRKYINNTGVLHDVATSTAARCRAVCEKAISCRHITCVIALSPRDVRTSQEVVTFPPPAPLSSWSAMRATRESRTRSPDRGRQGAKGIVSPLLIVINSWALPKNAEPERSPYIFARSRTWSRPKCLPTGPHPRVGARTLRAETEP